MAKTIRNSFDKKLTYESLMEAHKKSRKQKGYRKEIILFNLKQEEYITWLYQELKNQTYHHGGYQTFYIHEPKLRKIEKSRYIDRIVHRWVVDNFLEEYFIKTFISTSYACIKNKGMHRATLRVQKDMKHCKRIWGEYYILKMDIKKYFENINKDILYGLLQRKVKDKKLLWLLQEIVYSNEGKTGLAIGNYTSQVFANIYLNEVDYFVKHTLKQKYYYRYLDDSVIFTKTKQESKEALDNIRAFLRDKLQLELNQKTQIFKSKQGVNFCGYKINEYRLKIRDRGKRKLKKKVRYLTKQIRQGRLTSKEAKKYLCGHMGYIQLANVHNLTNTLFEKE